MSSEKIAIRVDNLSKRFEIYANPRDQLKQFIVPKLQTSLGFQKSQYFQDFWALKDVSFEIEKGDSVGVVGRNGSGKSTLLQLITGILRPTTGSISINGRIAALLELGSGFNPEFSGRENVYLNGALLGFSRNQMDDRFDSIAAFADIGSHLDQPVKTYSSGMLVRLAFAVQVQVNPDILIVDEALAVGDALFQKKCFQTIKKLSSQGTTLLLVSHDQESIRTLTNNALLLNHGMTMSWGKSSMVMLEYRKLLHEEEFAHFNFMVKSMAAGASKIEAQIASAANQDTSAEKKSTEQHSSEKLEFGDGDARVLGVQALNSEGEPCSIYSPGEYIGISIDCEAVVDIENLNVGVRLRNREGVKIYSWGTLNQDMGRLDRMNDEEIFWKKKFKAGEKFRVFLACDCSLGTNLYEIQAYVSHEKSPDFRSQRMLHWVDNAAFFQVLVRMDEYFFGGLVDLKMKASW